MNGVSHRDPLSVRPYFDRTMTLYIKGIALLLMLVHHFFTFPERYLPGIEYPYVELFGRIFQAPTRICVSTFAFLTGYFYYFNKNKTFAYSLKKDFQLLVSYWVAFSFVLGLCALGGFHFHWKEILLDALTLKKDIMVDSWYVQFYLLAMLVLPFVVRLVPKKELSSYLVGLGLPVILFTFLTELAPEEIAYIPQLQRQWFTSIMIGYLAAQNDLFVRFFDPVRDRFSRQWQKAAFGLALMATAMILRRFFFYGIFGVVFLSWDVTFQLYLDVFYAPIFVYGTVTFLQQVRLPKWVLTSLKSIGKLSLAMWFAQGLFFGPAKALYQPIAFLPRQPILVYIWALLLTYILAWCMDKVTGFLLRKR